jgi:hypothetical protein
MSSDATFVSIFKMSLWALKRLKKYPVKSAIQGCFEYGRQRQLISKETDGRARRSKAKNPLNQIYPANA